MTPLDRRDFLQMAAVTACAACLPLAGCRADETPDEVTLTINLTDLAEGVHVRRELAGKPLELLRRGDVITARSLLCTHQGCEVLWTAGENTYNCPCHDGRFDADGRPVYGPPRAPLRQYTVTVRSGVAVVSA